MLKIHQLFLRYYIAIFVAIFITLSLVIYFWAKSFYISQIERNLTQNIEIIDILIDDKKTLNSSLDIVKSISDKLNLRVSIIDENGVVIAESHKILEDIENHSNRKEIEDAIKFEFGKDTRVSKTLSKEFLYLAKKIDIENEIYIIRIAGDTSRIFEEFKSLILEIFIYMAIFLLISFFLSYFIGRRIKVEIDTILKFLESLVSKEKKDILKSNFTYEFNKIAKILNKVSLKLQERENEKSKYTAKLKFSNRQKDDIISAISHEFKNPIAVIKGYSETLLEDRDIKYEIKESFLKKIINSSDKLSKIIDKLRLSLNLKENKESLDLKETSIKNILENISSDLKMKYKSRAIILNGKDMNIVVDETLFNIAISNLLENALKYSLEDVYVEFDEKSISIIDKGIGIDELDLEKIRKKFYRVSQNGWNNSLGLGLYIVQTIVTLHDFKLEIESKKDEGSTFKIDFNR